MIQSPAGEEEASAFGVAGLPIGARPWYKAVRPLIPGYIWQAGARSTPAQSLVQPLDHILGCQWRWISLEFLQRRAHIGPQCKVLTVNQARDLGPYRGKIHAAVLGHDLDQQIANILEGNNVGTPLGGHLQYAPLKERLSSRNTPALGKRISSPTSSLLTCAWAASGSRRLRYAGI